MKKFFLGKNFNLIDTTTIAVSVGQISDGNFLVGFIVILVGSVISVILTRKFGG